MITIDLSFLAQVPTVIWWIVIVSGFGLTAWHAITQPNRGR